MLGQDIVIPKTVVANPRFEYVAMGHIHKYQVLTHQRPPIVYPGSLERIDFGEEREKKGFVIEGAWKIPSEERFVWVVAYDGPDDWEAANRAYYDSPERKAMDPDPASFIVAQRTVFIDSV